MSDEDAAGGPESRKPESAEAREAAAPAEATPAEPAGVGLAESSTNLSDVVEKPEAGAVEAYHQRARLAEDRLAEVLAAYRTLRTENEGYRDRITKNIERRYDQRRERLVLRFIDILDNLDRALDAAERTYVAQPLIEGLILVRTQLLQTLQDEGLERIPALGLPYDPQIAEAVEIHPVDDPDHHNVVVKEALRGYRLNGRIARAARVVVGQYHGEPVAAPSSQGDPPPPEPEAPSEVEPSLEDIVSRAEAQEALFHEAFDKADDKKSE